VASTLMVMGVLYVVVMAAGAFGFRIAPNGWKPAGWTPATSDGGNSMITRRHLHLNKAWKTPQFWLVWGVLFLNVTAGIAVISMASPMLQDVFGGKLAGLTEAAADLTVAQKAAIVAAAAGLVGLISLFNSLGRLFWASLSDKIGRKPVVLAGCLLAALTYFPIFKALTHYGNPAVEAASVSAPIKVTADPNDCHLQIDLIGKKVFTSSCDVAKSLLTKRGVPYENVVAAPGTVAVVSVGGKDFPSFDGNALSKEDFAARSKTFADTLGAAVNEAGYPAKAHPAQSNYPMLVVLLFILVLYVTMVYGPIAAWLVEMFPTRIRYTSMSLPYHIGNGWFGGFLPSVSFGIVAATGNFYNGLWYPVAIATMTFVIGLLFVRETKDTGIV